VTKVLKSYWKSDTLGFSVKELEKLEKKRDNERTENDAYQPQQCTLYSTSGYVDKMQKKRERQRERDREKEIAWMELQKFSLSNRP